MQICRGYSRKDLRMFSSARLVRQRKAGEIRTHGFYRLTFLSRTVVSLDVSLCDRAKFWRELYSNDPFEANSEARRSALPLPEPKSINVKSSKRRLRLERIAKNLSVATPE
jgi:hypothetical protein